jgi:dihydropyrimidinase
MSGPEHELVIRGGTVVTADSTADADVGIRDGRVVQVGGAMRGERELDASGKLVLPGGVDMHVHLSPIEAPEGPIPWADDFASGSRAAARGGVTTIGNITFSRLGEGLRSVVERTTVVAERDSIVDVVLHPVLTEPSEQNEADIRWLAAAGHTSVKFFMSLAEFDTRSGGFLSALRVAGESGMLTLVHCEDACIVSHVTERLVAEGRGDLSNYAEARPIFSERVAVVRAIGFAEAAGAPIYIVHLSSADALAEAHAAHARGLPVYVETRPMYLHLTAEKLKGPDGPLYVGQPPLREQRDQDALWNGLRAADVHTCCTDHAAWTLEQKMDPSLDVANLKPGTSDLETLMPMLYDRGVRTGRISLERFVEVTATNAAKLFGLYPRKGTIAVGGDADLAIWDPELRRTVQAADSQSRSGHTIYEGWEVTGWPATTLSRGEVIYADGEIRAEGGRGRIVPRARTRPL